MRCPGCGHPDDRVVDSRSVHNRTAIRRRRECENCERRFTTYERVDEVMPVIVKSDGRREQFSSDKLLHGLRIACRKRPVSTESLEDLVDDIGRALLASGDKEVSSAAIGDRVMDGLAKLDQVAFIRFASVYHSFENTGAFADLISNMKQLHKHDRADDQTDDTRSVEGDVVD